MRRPASFIRLFALSICLVLLAGKSAVAQTTATINTLYNFTPATDGYRPYAPLAQGIDGSFYGTTPQGGVNGLGTIFKVSPTGEFSVIYSFSGGSGGEGSLSGLFLASDGNFYGTCTGGNNGYGMVFKVSPNGTFTTLYSFTDGSDGATPEGGVIEGSDGNFYGTTAHGGYQNSTLTYTADSGTIFKMTPAGVLTTLYEFTGTNLDGSTPYAGLVEGSDGTFYGTTNNNEALSYYGVGTVFSITSTGTFTNLYTFTGGNDGANPDGGLVEGSDGSFYGSTHNGALYSDDDDDTGQGVLYNVTPTGTFKTVYQFTGQADSGRPEGTLFLGSDGNLYGTTTNSPMGTLFQATPAGVLNTLGPTGSNAEALSGPIVGSDGNLYGTTSSGGINSNGAIFQGVLTPSLAPAVQLTLSKPTVLLGSPVTLSWQVPNAFSNTAQHCTAFVQGGSEAAGAWTGVQTGTLTAGIYAGSAAITPTASGSYTYALSCGGNVAGFATLTVPAITVAATTLPSGTVSAAYTATLTETNGLAPFTWSVVSGSLPAGLTLDPATGIISGTPTQSGTFTLTAAVVDSESIVGTSSATFSISIATATATATVPSSTMTIATPGSSANTVLTLSGFASSAFNLSCSGLPAKAQCIFGGVTGSQTYATVPLQITTEGGLTSKLVQPASSSHPTYAFLLPGVIVLLGLAGSRHRSRALRLLCLMVFLASAGAALTGCSGSSSKPVVETNSTPAGTSTVTVTAVAGDQSATTTITLTVQ